MILHRFMSEAEYDVLISGGKLLNTTDHHKERGNKTTSVGFCFFPEPPDKAIHWLSGIVNTEVCVTFDIDESLLTESTATYRDHEKDNSEGMSLWELIFSPAPQIFSSVPQIERKEYCMTEYSLKVAKVLSVTTKYRDYFEKILSGEWDEQGTFTARVETD